MAALTVAELADALRLYYTDKKMAVMAYKNHALLAMIRKVTDWTGDRYIVPIQPSVAVAGRSAVFATAQANAAGGTYERWELTTVKDFGVLTIDNEAILASEGQGARAFVAAKASEIDGIMISLGSQLGMGIYRNGGGARGRRASAATDVITLTNASDVVNFEKGMVIRASAADGTSGALRTGSTTITAVSRGPTTSTITLASAAAISGFADNDYLFVDGDFGALPSGLDAWLPSSDPGATAFFGVNRSVEPQRLGGLRYSDTNPLVEKLQRAFAWAMANGATDCRTVFVNPLDLSEIEIALGDRCRIDSVRSADGVFGFDSIRQNTAIGRVDYVGDPDCPRNVAYALDLEQVEFVSRGKAPRNISLDDGGLWLRQASAAGVEGRFGWYGNLMVRAPGKCMRIALT